MAMSLQDLLAAIAGGQGMSPISQGFSPATRMPQGGGRGDARLGPRPLNPKPRPPMKPQPRPRPLPGRPGSYGPGQARPLPSIKPRPGRPAPAQDGMRPMPLIIDRDDPNMPSQFMEQLGKPRGSFAGERVQPQLPQPMMQPAAAPPRMNEQELMEMLFAAYQDRNMSGRNRGARGFRGRPVTGI
tara:strand:+ start:1872 stop:2426 length:555 start_codon:yes stop_codon:yes gene_type:complete